MTLLAYVLCGVAFAQNATSSELLQKGIYLQETVGDLDGAIRVYKQITQMARESRANAAQAEYRLGVCLQKKGQQAEAIGVFQKLIKEYPEQTELAAKAHQFTDNAANPAAAGGVAGKLTPLPPPLPASRPGELKLLPAPWKDGEVLEYTGGPRKMWQSFQSSKAGDNRWLFEKHSTGSFERLEFDSETMQPVSTFEATNGNFFRVRYQAHAAQITESNRKPISSTILEGLVFDADEIPAVLRRLPWTRDYKVTLPVFGGSSARVVNYEFVVTGEEDVETPAGSFHCYRVQQDNLAYRNLASARFWISDDAAHLVVKDSSGMVLAAPPGTDPQETIYTDERTGASLLIPAGWVVGKPSGTWQSANFFLEDLHSTAFLALKFLTHDARDDTPEGVQSEAEREAANAEMITVRPQSWQLRQINGHNAVTWIEDQPFYSVVRYRALIRTGTSAVGMVAQSDPRSFDALRPTFDGILNTLVVR